MSLYIIAAAAESVSYPEKAHYPLHCWWRTKIVYKTFLTAVLLVAHTNKIYNNPYECPR